MRVLAGEPVAIGGATRGRTIEIAADGDRRDGDDRSDLGLRVEVGILRRFPLDASANGNYE